MIAIIKCCFFLWVTYFLLIQINFPHVNCLVLTILFTLRTVFSDPALIKQMKKNKTKFWSWIKQCCHKMVSVISLKSQYLSWGSDHQLHNKRLILVTAVAKSFVLDRSVCVWVVCWSLHHPTIVTYLHLLSAKPHGWQHVIPFTIIWDIITVWCEIAG